MTRHKGVLSTLGAALFTLLLTSTTLAQNLPTRAELRAALREVVAEDNGGFGFNMGATVVDRDGVVKAALFSGEERGDLLPGSRLISVQKANTANALAFPNLPYQRPTFTRVRSRGAVYTGCSRATRSIQG